MPKTANYKKNDRVKTYIAAQAGPSGKFYKAGVRSAVIDAVRQRDGLFFYDVKLLDGSLWKWVPEASISANPGGR